MRRRLADPERAKRIDRFLRSTASLTADRSDGDLWTSSITICPVPAHRDSGSLSARSRVSSLSRVADRHPEKGSASRRRVLFPTCLAPERTTTGWSFDACRRRGVIHRFLCFNSEVERLLFIGCRIVSYIFQVKDSHEEAIPTPGGERPWRGLSFPSGRRPPISVPEIFLKASLPIPSLFLDYSTDLTITPGRVPFQKGDRPSGSLGR